jgi:hypothetical protein
MLSCSSFSFLAALGGVVARAMSPPENVDLSRQNGQRDLASAVRRRR